MSKGAAIAWRIFPVAALAVVVIALAGCSGGATANASPVATTNVDLPKSYRFSPPAIVVDVGATVTWTNDDNFTHNVTFDGAPGAQLKPGASTTKTFSTAGTFHYQCTLHPQDMQGTVTVKGT
jgi:plastocyanin